MTRFRRIAAGIAFAIALVVSAARADVFNMPYGETSLQFVTVGNPGNPPDTTVANDGTSGYGSVPYVYQMGTFDVTLGQYCQFLNAVAESDPNGLYNSGMSGFSTGPGIIQSGDPGRYTYSVSSSNPQVVNMPVFFVTWVDAARFCNWLQNGQPTSGTEGAGTTETGAYTLNGTLSNAESATRTAGATYYIPTENEWYKSAYYNPLLNSGSGGYYTYRRRKGGII